MDRYSRQELFAPIGKAGQDRIRAATVAVVGCGALGSLQAEALTRAGVGRLLLIDRDFVEFSNLQRQSLFTESDAAQSLPKAVAAASHLKLINSEIDIVPVIKDLDQDSCEVISSVSLILDGTDNFATRYLVNDYCWQQNIAWVYGACVGSAGTASVFLPPEFPCLRCVFESEPPPGSGATCDTAGIIWPAVAAVVSYQITAAFKILIGDPVNPAIFQCDVWQNEYRTISIERAKRPHCATCGLRTFPSLRKGADFAVSLCGRDAVQLKPAQPGTLDLPQLATRWEKLGPTYLNPFLAKLKIAEQEIVLFPDGRAIIKGTHDFARARTLYSKYVGS